MLTDVPPDTNKENKSASGSGARIVWLDILRVLCAIEIVGFHWLRAGVKTGAFAGQTPKNLIVGYRQLDIGLAGALQALNVDPSGSRLHQLIYDGIGIVFGFGWEAVFVFVLLSGTSLSLSLAGGRTPSSWFSWIIRRLKRILIPFYVIAGIVLCLMFAALAATASSHHKAIEQLHLKIAANIGSDFSGIIWSQLFLFDPHARFGSPAFLAPAWWFVPAILLAYAMFPSYMWLLKRVGTWGFLAVGGLISILSYEAVLHEHVQEFSWWFIVLNECFNFFLGIVLGSFLSTAQGRERAERALRSKGLIFTAVGLFLVGNLCNLYLVTYPISSLLFTGPLTLCGSAFAFWISRWTWSRSLLKIDSYDLYLVHQPLAFPLIVLSALLFGKNAILIGLPIYFAVVLMVSMLFSKTVVRSAVALFDKPRIGSTSSAGRNIEAPRKGA